MATSAVTAARRSHHDEPGGSCLHPATNLAHRARRAQVSAGDRDQQRRLRPATAGSRCAARRRADKIVPLVEPRGRRVGVQPGAGQRKRGDDSERIEPGAPPVVELAPVRVGEAARDRVDAHPRDHGGTSRTRDTRRRPPAATCPETARDDHARQHERERQRRDAGPRHRQDQGRAP